MRLTFVVAVCALAAGIAGTAAADVYSVAIENMIPGGAGTGQPFTPPVCVIHDSDYSILVPGMLASPGLMYLAEDGVTDTLVAEAMQSPDVDTVFVAAMKPFFDHVEFVVEGEPGQLISLVSMLARTNDLVTGVFDVPLPAVGAVVMEPPVYDAGTEENTGLVADIPFYGNMFVGPSEEAPVDVIDCYSVKNDPKNMMLTWCFPPGARVSISHIAGGAKGEWGSKTMSKGGEKMEAGRQ
jgi:hypothetical protein